MIPPGVESEGGSERPGSPASCAGSGPAEPFSEYRGSHLSADMRFSAATERELLSEDATLSPGDDGVLYFSTYRMTGTVGDREIDVPGTETMVLVTGKGGGWSILHIH